MSRGNPKNRPEERKSFWSAERIEQKDGSNEQPPDMTDGGSKDRRARRRGG